MIRFFKKPLQIFTMLAVIVSASSALTDTFPSVTGVWAGSYRVAFPADHPKYPDQSVETSMELDIYQQESNLIWVINRWRRDANEPWVVEYATGSFDLEDRSDLVITEKGPAENEHVNTGVFTGELEDGDLYLNYIGLGDGITFSVKLSRQ